MKNILLPLDLCKNTKNLLKRALAFLQETGTPTNIFLLKTYTVSVDSTAGVIEAHDHLQTQSLQELQRELKAAQSLATSDKLSFEIVLQMGHPANVITRVVKEKNIDCILLESRAYGSRHENEMNLWDRIHCPMIVFPD